MKQCYFIDGLATAIAKVCIKCFATPVAFTLFSQLPSPASLITVSQHSCFSLYQPLIFSFFIQPLNQFLYEKDLCQRF
jgi:hypothetical protein